MNQPHVDFPRMVRAALSGDQGAAMSLMEQFGPLVIAIIRRRLARELRSQFDSVDFAQAVWASMFLMPSLADEELSVDAFTRKLVSVASNKVTDEYRKRLGTKKYDLRREIGRVGSSENEVEVPTKDPSPSEVVIAREYWERLVLRASSTSRAILQLRLEGFKQHEIADRLGISERTVRRALTECLERQSER